MQTPTESRRPRVLVVEDEEDVRDLLCKILADAGFQADGAEDGGPAIERIEASRPELVVLDLMMPIVEGWAVVDHLGRMPAAPPVVVLTARGDHETLARGLREGIAAYVIKPFDIRILVATCHRALADAASPAPVPVRERRLSPRSSIVVEATAQSADGAPLGQGSLVNLGARGALVVLDAALEPGSRVTLTIRTLDAGSPLQFEAEVRWREDSAGRYVTGLTFVGASAEAARRLAELFPSQA